MARKRYTFNALVTDTGIYNEYLKRAAIPRKYAPQGWYGDSCVELHDTDTGKQLTRLEIGTPRECHAAMVEDYHNQMEQYGKNKRDSA